MILRGKNFGNRRRGEKSNGRVHHITHRWYSHTDKWLNVRCLGRIHRVTGGALPIFVEGIFATLAAIGVILAILVIIGAILIYMPGKEIIGGILVIIFSILSIFIGGGFLIGLILGIIGGALGLAKK